MKRLQNQFIYLSANALRKLGYGFNEQASKPVRDMQAAIATLDNHAIQFKVEQYPDGTWSAESTNVDGIMTGGTDQREAPELLKDAVFTYFEIPSQFCNDSILRTDNEPAKVKQYVYIGA